MLAYLLSEFKLSTVPGYMIAPISLEAVREYFQSLGRKLAVESFPGRTPSPLISQSLNIFFFHPGVVGDLVSTEGASKVPPAFDDASSAVCYPKCCYGRVNWTAY
jgi:hypothetical protein